MLLSLSKAQINLLHSRLMRESDTVKGKYNILKKNDVGT